MTKCEICYEVTEQVINKVVVGGSCAACEALIAAAFTALEIADILQPEFEPVIAAVEIVFESVFSYYCNKYGTQWIKDNVEEFSKEVCKKAGLC